MDCLWISNWRLLGRADGLALVLLREATIGDQGKRRQRLADLDSLARMAKLDDEFLAEWARKMGYGKALAEWKQT